MSNQEIKKQIKSAIDIVDYIGQTVSLKHISGNTWKGATDSSSKSGESLNVDRGKQIFKDWANDGVKGDVFSWIAFKESLDEKNDFPQILSIAGEYTGIEIPHQMTQTRDKNLLKFNKEVANYYNSQLTDEMRKHIVDTWGITAETVDALKIGFAPVKDSLVSKFEDKFSIDVIKKSGLIIDTGYGVKDFYSGRIVFPYWKGVDVVYSIGRQYEGFTPDSKYEKAKYKKQLVHSDKKKYVSEDVNNSYFYGENTLKGVDYCLITEGVTDCIMAQQCGIPCISPVTTRFRNEDFEKIYELTKRMDNVFICNDSEDNESGLKGAIDTAVFLESKDIDVRIVNLPRPDGVDKIDLADFLRDTTKEDFERLMVDESVYIWDMLLGDVKVPKNTTSKIRTCKAFLEKKLSGMPDDTFHTFALNDVCTKFGFGKRDMGRIIKTIDRSGRDDDDEPESDEMEFFNDYGKLQVKTLSEYVMSLNFFKTIDDNKRVYCYHSGIYKPDGDDIITKCVHELLGDATKKHHVAEVIHYIQFATLIHRKDVMGDTAHVNLLNGVYDIETDTLHDHSPDEMYITQIPVTYDKNATCETLSKFITEIAHSYDIDTIYEFIGYCMIPDSTIQKAVMLVGDGSNGKSKLLNVIRMFIGNDNSSSESLHDLETDTYSKAELFGKLVNIFPDLASGMIFENSAFKMLTGDEGVIRAERKYEHPFSFKNTARLIFSANKLPPVPADNFAYFRRWILLEFPNKFEGGNADKNILDKISTPEQLSGLFNAAIIGLKRLMKNGNYTSSKPTGEIESMYRINSDHISAFENECITYSSDDCLKHILYEEYVKWCGLHEIVAKTNPIFSKRFKKIGYNSGRQSSGQRMTVWENCAIVEKKLMENDKTLTNDDDNSRSDESVRVSDFYPDGENRYAASNPSGCQGKNPLLFVHVGKFNKKTDSQIINPIDVNSRAKSGFTLTDCSETNQPMPKKIRQGRNYTPDGILSPSIDIKKITKCIIDEKNKSHPSGIIPNVEQFATLVKYNNKEILKDVKVEDIINMTHKLSSGGW